MIHLPTVSQKQNMEPSIPEAGTFVGKPQEPLWHRLLCLGALSFVVVL